MDSGDPGERSGATGVGAAPSPAVCVDERYYPDQGLSPEAAGRLQREWADLIVEEPLSQPPALIAGSDMHVGGDRALATIVVLRFPSLEPVETVHGEAAIGFPYVPGLLSWRELPALLNALARLTVRPDLLFADGHGIAHPRRFGLACHLGLAANIPTLGCAKSILRGQHAPLVEGRGVREPLVYRGRVVGTAVRTKDRVTPLYVSVGHRVALPEAVDYVLRSCTKYRLPEPNRLAHLAAQARARSPKAARYSSCTSSAVLWT